MAERVSRPLLVSEEPPSVGVRLPRPHVNWSLLLGSLIVLLVLGVAIWGPRVAPRDPLEENSVIRVGGEWMRAPFGPFAVPGFPLGTDDLGRDLLSRLLWAVRPTMIIVTVAALARMALGTLAGVAAGWSVGRVGRGLDALIGSALAVPIFFVALAVIALLQTRWGTWAFVLGLTLTGWAETARLVRERTRIVKTQTFIEAARAVGGSDVGIVARHVLRQIAPLLWVLFSFEVSSVLLTIAGLGFIGYFVGGQVWIMVTDFVARRETGYPDLGQMLQKDYGELLTGPVETFAAGGTVFLIVLGFNLLGEGLRQQASMEVVRRRTLFSVLSNRAGAWGEDVLLPTVRRNRPLVFAGLAVVVLAAGGAWWRARPEPAPEEPLVALEIPGGHLWASGRGDPYGSRWRDVVGPSNPTIQWSYAAPGGFAGGPAVAGDGTLYLTGRDNKLIALNGDGSLRWESPLPQTPVGSPALGLEGEIYVADALGHLTAFNPDGSLRWQFEQAGTLAAGAGPIVAPDGTIFYTVGPSVQAVSAEGEGLWQSIATRGPKRQPPSLSPDGRLVFLDEGALYTEDGRTLEGPQVEEANPVQYMVGGDGWSYLRRDDFVMQWRLGQDDIEPLNTAFWERGQFAYILPADAGITRSHIAWLIHWNQAQDARFIWLDTQKNVMVGSAITPHRPTSVISLDRNNVAYVCGLNRTVGPECMAVALGAPAPAWQLRLPQGSDVVGGALTEGRLYVTMTDGFLHALGAP